MRPDTPRRALRGGRTARALPLLSPGLLALLALLAAGCGSVCLQTGPRSTEEADRVWEAIRRARAAAGQAPAIRAGSYRAPRQLWCDLDRIERGEITPEEALGEVLREAAYQDPEPLEPSNDIRRSGGLGSRQGPLIRHDDPHGAITGAHRLRGGLVLRDTGGGPLELPDRLLRPGRVELLVATAWLPGGGSVALVFFFS